MSIKSNNKPTMASANEDDWIEDEIQRELDALDLNDVAENNEDCAINDNKVDEIGNFEEDVPDTVSAYLIHVLSRTDGLTKELEECNQILKDIPENNKEFYYNSKELNELAFILGEDPEELRDRVINELEDEDCADVESSKHADDNSYKEKQKSDGCEITEENGKVALILEADILEQVARQQIQELEDKHRARNMVATKEREFQLRADACRQQEVDEARKQMKDNNEKQQRELAQSRKVHQEKEQKILEEENKRIKFSLQQYEKEINEFSEKMEEEKKVFEKEVHLRQTQKEQQEKQSAILIQSVFRSYRARKPYLKRLNKLRADLKERREQERQCEILTERRKEEQRRKKEMIEKKRKEEEERKRKEELIKKEEEQRKEEERKRKEAEEQERLRKEQIEKERLKKEQLKREEEEKERLELKQKENEILEKIKKEKEKSDKIEQERIESERIKMEKERLEQEKMDQQKEIQKDMLENKTVNMNKDTESKHNTGNRQSSEKTIRNNYSLQEPLQMEHECVIKQNITKPGSDERPASFSSQNSPDDLTNATGDLPQNVPDNLPQNSPNHLYHNTSDDIPQKTQNQPSHYAPENSSQNTPDDLSTKSPEVKSYGDNENGKPNCHSVSDVNYCNVLNQSGSSRLSQDVADNLSGKVQDISSSNNNSVPIHNDKLICVGNSTNLQTSATEKNKQVKGSTEFNLLPPMSELLEARRLSWIQKCVPFSKIQSQVKGFDLKNQRQKRRPTAAKKLQPVTAEQLLSASPLQTSLAQVTTVRLRDLPGCTLTSMNQCHDLIAMEIQNSNLVALEGLENSDKVKYINVKNNKIEYISCKDKKHLVSLNLSHNNLSMVHGLDDCPGLRRLVLSHNKITKLGSIALFCNLQVLNVSHNQLMTSEGLRSLVMLQQVDLSNNHLSSVDDLENCGLLQKLNIASNNLSQIPSLQNQVLLQELNLCNNSLSKLDALSDCWLPCLRHLNVSENSLEEIPPSLHGMPFLCTLDISHNFISDVVKLSGLKLFGKLQYLHLEGNAVKEEHTVKSYVLSLLPLLQYLDSEKLTKDKEVVQPASQFEAFCESQIKFLETLNTNWKKDFEFLNNQGDLLKVADLDNCYLTQMENIMKEHRYMHEYGDTTVIEPVHYKSHMESNTVEGSWVTSEQQVAGIGQVLSSHTNSQSAHVNKQDVEDGIIKSVEQDEVNTRVSSDIRTGVVTTKSFVQQTQGKWDTDRAATLIQAYWRGHCIRRDIRRHSERWLAAVTIQACWRRLLANKKVRIMKKTMRRNRKEVNALQIAAAIIIQAWWRGTRTRRFIRNARQQATMEIDDDFCYDEIDLSSFDYIENDWRPSDEPQLPLTHPPLPPHPSHHQPSPPTQERPPSRTVRHAWRNVNSPHQYHENNADILIVEASKTARSGCTDTPRDIDMPRDTTTGKPPLPPLSGLSGSTLKTSRSDKQDQISEDWGFKDGNTALLMMKRAKKMKGKKKVEDPLQRFKMIKKIQDTARQQPIQLSKKGIQRKEYFQGRAEEIARKEEAPRREMEEKNKRTFEWLHSQIENPSDPRTTSKGMMGRHTYSEPSLPRMSPDVLQGRVQLIASPSIDLQSVDSRSTTSSFRHRSNSFSSPDGNKIQVSTTKTNSAPTNHTRQRLEAKAKHRGYYK